MFRFQRAYSSLSEHEKLISLLNSCTQTSEITLVHGHMIKTGLDILPFPLSKLLASAIVDINYAAKIYKEINNPNLFMFNTLLRGYSISGKPKEAFLVFNTLRAKGIFLDEFSFICTLKACARDMAVDTGLAIHGVVFQSGFEFFLNVRNTLLHFYSVCRKIGDAHQLFDMFPQKRDLVSWNTLMGGYLKISQPVAVLDLFKQMRTFGLDLSITTILTVLSACGDLRNFWEGEALHSYCIKRGFCSEMNLVTAIIAMYAKSGFMGSARKIFDGVSQKDVVLWNCIIEGYLENGLLEESICLLRQMKWEGMKPNSATLAGLLRTCAESGALAIGESIHGFIEEELLVVDEVLGTALLDMYSKCGFVGKAVDVFEQMQSKDVRAWTAMITGYGINGQGMDAIRLFEKMEAVGVMPNEITFLALLNACSHCGLVTEGKYCFERMIRVYDFLPAIQHYGCMIDLLGRAGLLEDGYELIKSLPIERDTRAWRALLAACRVHGDAELGEIAKRTLEQLNDEHPTDTILLLNSYAIHGRWDDIAKMTGKQPMRKERGWSSIEMHR
ncbi:Pentatricopeptide repeat-containing protein [Thalictrum thalictroides]|uniref:Pentatricopeptide repeat-containing protein n=1 Tax=Thalictrum thalictroides TaxID=46969 RepID=A0A7J6VXJ4_THATH|nr:Pentatricopeptide repeat-containing protein [Thalictrum thalictroides]